jgi:hypothetical protein
MAHKTVSEEDFQEYMRIIVEMINKDRQVLGQISTRLIEVEKRLDKITAPSS